MDIDQIFQFIGLFLSISVIGWGVVKWLLGRIDTVQNLTKDSYSELSRDLAHVHRRVDEVKDTYVKRTDVDRDFRSIEQRMDRVEKSIAEGSAQTNQRLDRLLMMIGKLIKNSPAGGDDLP